jgi:hypothetical protein
VTSNDGRRPHRRHDGLFRRGYPILAVGVVLAVVGVSWLLVGGPESGTPVLAAGQAPAAGPASVGTIYGCASPGGGFSSLSFTVAPACPRGTYRVSWQVQLTQPAPAGSPATAPVSTAARLPTAAPTDTPTAAPTDTPTFAPTGTPTSSSGSRARARSCRVATPTATRRCGPWRRPSRRTPPPTMTPSPQAPTSTGSVGDS